MSSERTEGVPDMQCCGTFRNYCLVLVYAWLDLTITKEEV